MAGLLSGNPYYSGPSPLAAGVNAFTDNFMKGTEFFQKMDQEKLQQQMMQEKLAEYENEKKMRAEMAAYNQPRGLMGPALPVAPVQEPQMSMAPGSEAPWGVQSQQPQMSTPEPQAPPPQSEEEYLKGAYAIISKYNPEKALALREQLYAAKSKADVQAAILDFKIAAQDAKTDYANKILDMKNNMVQVQQDRAAETARHNAVIEALKASKGSGSGGEGKGTEFDRDYKDYSDWFNETTGNKASGYYQPGAQKMSRGQYREYKIRQESAAKSQGALQGLVGGAGIPAVQPSTTPAKAPGNQPKNLTWNPKTGRLE